MFSRCKHCGYTICDDCHNIMDDIRCAQCRKEDLFYSFERSIQNYDTTIPQLVKELDDECKNLNEELQDNFNFMEFIHAINMCIPNEIVRTQLINVLLNIKHSHN